MKIIFGENKFKFNFSLDKFEKINKFNKLILTTINNNV